MDASECVGMVLFGDRLLSTRRLLRGYPENAVDDAKYDPLKIPSSPSFLLPRSLPLIFPSSLSRNLITLHMPNLGRFQLL